METFALLNAEFGIERTQRGKTTILEGRKILRLRNKHHENNFLLFMS